MTFELPDKEVLCFYEEIEVHTKCLLDYQVCDKARSRAHASELQRSQDITQRRIMQEIFSY